MNICCLIGNITKDPELRYTPQGTAITKLTVAVNETYGDRKDAHFFDVTVWGKSAENCNMYLTKGNKICVIGSLRQERWEKDGQKRSRVIVNAQKVEFLTPKKQTDDTNEQETEQEPEAGDIVL